MSSKVAGYPLDKQRLILSMKNSFKVTAQGDAYAVQSQKAEGGQLMKCEYNGQVYQDIVVNEIMKLNN